MKHHLLTTSIILGLSATLLQPAASAGDKKKPTQQELQQQWKLQQMQQQRQAGANQRPPAAAAGRPWSASRGGTGRIQEGKNGVPALSASATLSNFWSPTGGVNNSGAAVVSLNSGQYSFRGTWTVAKTGPSHVWLKLGGVSGTLEMSGSSGTALQNIVLNGTANGVPFAANFR